MASKFFAIGASSLLRRLRCIDLWALPDAQAGRLGLRDRGALDI